MTWALTLDGRAVNLDHVTAITASPAGFRVGTIPDGPDAHLPSDAEVYEITARTTDGYLYVLGLRIGADTARAEVARIATRLCHPTAVEPVQVPTSDELLEAWEVVSDPF